MRLRRRQRQPWQCHLAASFSSGCALETENARPHIRDQPREAHCEFPTSTFRRGVFIMTIVRYEPWALVSRFHRQLDRALDKDADSVRMRHRQLDPARGHPRRGRALRRGRRRAGRRRQGHRDHRREGRAHGTRRAPLREEGDRRTGTRASSVPAARSCAASPCPESADAEAIKATHVNGVLEISIPKRPQEQPRRITVQAA